MGNATTETQAAFAKRKGVSPKTVSIWKQAGHLSMTPDGLVKVEESEWLLAERPATRRGGKAKGSTPSAPATKPTPSDDGGSVEEAAERFIQQTGGLHSHAEAARIKENFLAALRQLEYDRESGKVVEIATVAAAVVTEYAKVRNKVLGLGSRLAHRLAAMKLPEEIKALVDAEVSTILEELTLDGHGSVAAADLAETIRDRLNPPH